MFDVCLRGPLVSFKLENRYTNELQLRKTGGFYLSRSHKCPLQSGHDDFTYTHNDSPRFFMLLSAALLMSFWVCPLLCNFVYHAEKEKQKLAKFLEIDEVELFSIQCLLGMRVCRTMGLPGKSTTICDVICMWYQRGGPQHRGCLLPFNVSRSRTKILVYFNWHYVLAYEGDVTAVSA